MYPKIHMCTYFAPHVHRVELNSSRLESIYLNLLGALLASTMALPMPKTADPSCTHRSTCHSWRPRHQAKGPPACCDSSRARAARARETATPCCTSHAGTNAQRDPRRGPAAIAWSCCTCGPPKMNLWSKRAAPAPANASRHAPAWPTAEPIDDEGGCQHRAHTEWVRGGVLAAERSPRTVAPRATSVRAQRTNRRGH